MKTLRYIAIIAALAIASVASAHGYQSRSFDGSTGMRTTNNFTAFGASAITVEFWIKAAAPASGTFWVFADINNGATQKMNFSSSGNGGSNNIAFELNTGASNRVSAAVANTLVLDGTWHHLAGTYDGSNVHIYLDGVEQGTPTAATGVILVAAATKLGVGFRQISGIGKITGTMTDLRIYQVALTGSQILSTYKNRIPGNTTDLTGYWRLDNNLLDSTSNANTMTIGSGTNAPSIATPFPVSDPWQMWAF